MNPGTIAIGVLAAAYGIFSGVMRFVRPSMFRKLESMQRTFGAGLGSAIHFVAYVIVPIGFGIVVIVAGMRGVTLSDLF